MYKNATIALLGLCLAAWTFALSARAAEIGGPLAELHHDLAVKRLAAMQPILTTYRQQLDELANQFTRDGKMDEVRNAQQEKALIEAELTRLTKTVAETKVTLPQAQATPPPPAPVLIKRTPKTHVSSVQGLAGAASFSENNVYNFTLPEVGSTSTLTFYATGRRSIDSVGQVWLVTPDGDREKVSKWKSGYFEDPATEIKSYKNLKPISEDISKYVQAPGTYRVEFEWTDGIDPLVIFRVEITS